VRQRPLPGTIIRPAAAGVKAARAYDAEGDKAAVQREVQEVNRQLPGGL
jgi:hypothetical protein